MVCFLTTHQAADDHLGSCRNRVGQE